MPLRNVLEKSCLQHEAWLRIKTESPNAYTDNLMHVFECSQKSSDNLPTPTPHPAPHHRTVLFFKQKLLLSLSLTNVSFKYSLKPESLSSWCTNPKKLSRVSLTGGVEIK